MRYGWSHAPQYQIISQNRHNYPTLLDKVIQLNPIGRYLFVKLTTEWLVLLEYVVNDCRPGTALIIRFYLGTIDRILACSSPIAPLVEQTVWTRRFYVCLCLSPYPVGRRNLFMSCWGLFNCKWPFLFGLSILYHNFRICKHLFWKILGN